MNFDLSRRTFLFRAIALILGTAAPAVGEQQAGQSVMERIAAIEQGLGGRVGIAAIDTSNGKRIDYRATERFPLCSTFKFLAAAAVLQRVDKKEEQLDRRIPYGADDLLEWAPITKEHLQEGSMTLDALCAAAIEYSDNTAGNLLLQLIGGPKNLTEYVRSLGDLLTRLDRIEPFLNTAIKGDDRDTTSPDAMLSDMDVLLLGDQLSKESRERLEAWMVSNTMGGQRLRAGLPSTWRVGDKTGTGQNGATADIAILRPPNRAPILVAVYLAGSTKARPDLNAAFADVGRIIADVF